MKNVLLLLLLTIACQSCKKEYNIGYGANANQFSLQNSTVAASGGIVFSGNGNGGGVAKIYLRKDGVYILGLEGMNFIAASNASVYLSTVSGLDATSIKIFSAISFSDNIYNNLSSNINIAAYKYLVIQLDSDNSTIAKAALG